MHVTHEAGLRTGPEELTPEETRNIPFFGFVTGTFVSAGLWSWIALAIWALLR